jgi:hypothetical protein
MTYVLASLDAQIRQDKETKQSERYHSVLLEDYYTELPSGGVIFESGVIYTALELDKLRSVDSETKKSIHTVKLIFKGSKLE